MFQSCQADLVKDNGHKYFLLVLADPYMPVSITCAASSTQTSQLHTSDMFCSTFHCKNASTYLLDLLNQDTLTFTFFQYSDITRYSLSGNHFT